MLECIFLDSVNTSFLSFAPNMGPATHFIVKGGHVLMIRFILGAQSDGLSGNPGGPMRMASIGDVDSLHFGLWPRRHALI